MNEERSEGGFHLMRWSKISDAVVRRLPLYLRVLEEASREGERRLMSSQELGERAGVGPALVRKDLAWFGEFGKQGVGYEVEYLKDELRRILNLDQPVHVGLVGVGSLGQALVRYSVGRYDEDPTLTLRITALFDNDPAKIGHSVAGVPVRHVDDLPAAVEELKLRMMIVTVPAAHAQSVVDRVVEAGVKAILNFAPVKLKAPDGVHLSTADFSLELQRLAYYLGSD